MGISPSTADHLADTCQRLSIGGRMLSLGRQDIHMNFEQFVALMLRRGFAREVGPNKSFLAPPTAMETMDGLVKTGRHLSPIAGFRERGMISDKLLFAGMGFVSCDSVDGNSFDAADHIYDLNDYELGRHLGRQYNFVLDCGTLEHVFDTRAVLKNMFDTTAVGGFVMHLTPSNNHVDHGFYQISPTFYADYYSANQFRICAMKFFRYTANANVEPWYYSEYTPGALDGIPLDNAYYGVSFCAQKLEQSTWDKIPIQGTYRKQWR